jgi:chondroitin 4-sulfotransferase 11
MISHDYRCIFTHVPKTAGKSVRALFGLPEFERDYKPNGENIELAFGHRRLCELDSKPYFTDYFKFATVRNPFDRIVSAYFYLDNGGCNSEDEKFRAEHLARYNHCFSAFVEDLPILIAAPHFQPQVHWICNDEGRLLVDFLGRYENLRADMHVVGKAIGLSFNMLPVINASKHAPYRDYYDQRTKRRVEQLYGNDIEIFSYRF